MSCPVGQTLDGSLCQAPCPDGFTASTTDNTICQSSVSCVALGLLVNNDDPQLCNKQAPTTPPCSAPKVLQANECYDICPASMIDNTTTCLKRLFTRIGVVPICGGSQIWNGDACVSIANTGGSSSDAPRWFQVILLAFLSAFLFLYASTFVFEGPTSTIGSQLGNYTKNTLIGHQ